MKHRWAPEGCAIVCGAAWLAALMGGGMLWMGISRSAAAAFFVPGGGIWNGVYCRPEICRRSYDPFFRCLVGDGSGSLLGRRKCPAEASKQKIIKPGNSGAER